MLAERERVRERRGELLAEGEREKGRIASREREGENC